MPRRPRARKTLDLMAALALWCWTGPSVEAHALQGSESPPAQDTAPPASPPRWGRTVFSDPTALASHVASARTLAAAAGVVGAPVVAKSIVAASAMAGEDAPTRLTRWVATIERYREAVADELGRRQQFESDVGWMIVFIAADQTQARIVRAGALDDATASNMGPRTATLHRRAGSRDVTIVLDGGDEAGRVAEDALLEVVSASLHQLVSEGEVPTWMVEAISHGTARRLHLAMPGLDTSRAELVKSIRTNPLKALGGFAQGTESPPGAGMLAWELLAREQPAGLAKAILLIKDGADPGDAIESATGISMPRLADGIARWYRTND